MVPRNQPPAEPWYAGQACRTQRERWDAVARAWPDLFDANTTQHYRCREIALPGLLRLADLYLHVRGRRAWRLLAAAEQPFVHAETRWEWARRLGYLVAVVARKTPSMRVLS